MHSQDATPSEPNEAEFLEEQYSMAERNINKVSRELHIPFLEVKLYTKFFLSMRDRDHLQATLAILNAVLDHKRLTLRVLGFIEEREKVVKLLKQLAFRYSRKDVSTVEVQTQTFQLLYQLQQATLRVVEGVAQWRAGLTRPYPFLWHRVNYFLRIIGDCQFLDSSDLSKVLPIQLSAHPLCSNLTSLSLFGGGAGTRRPISASYPVKKRYLAGDDATARVQRAEVAIYEEHGMQRKLLQELMGLAEENCFITMLNLPALIPNCGKGIKVTNKEWAKRYYASLLSASSALDNTASIVHDVSSPTLGEPLHKPSGTSQRDNHNARGVASDSDSAFGSENSSG